MYGKEKLNISVCGSENSSLEQFIDRSEQLLTGNMILQSQLPAIKFQNTFIDWNMQAERNSDSVQLLLQSLTPVPILCKAFLHTNKFSYIKLAIEIFESWYDYQKDISFSGKNAYTWNTHAVANRTQYLIFLLLICKNLESIDQKILFHIQEILLKQGKWLNQPEHYFQNCNHGIYQDRSLIYLGKLWDNDDTKEWLLTAKQRLQSQKNFAFNIENVHAENSPAYHEVVLNLFYTIAEFLKQFGDTYGEQLFEEVKKSAVVLAWFIKPDGYFAEVGDTERIKLGITKKNEAPEDYDVDFLKYVISNGKEKIKHVPKYTIYPTAGYFFCRDSYDPNNINKDTWFMFKSGYCSKVHKHGDDLSFMLNTKGYDVFIDTGKYGNTIGNPIVDYLHSSLAHNTVVVDEKPYHISDTKGYLSGIAEYNFNENLYYVRGFLDAYPGVYIDRAIYKMQDTILIHDEIQSSEKHIYSQMFHLSEHIKTTIQTNEDFMGIIGDSGYSVQIRQLTPVDAAYLFSGRKTCRNYGYHSSKMGEITDCTTLQYEKCGNNVDFVTLIRIVKNHDFNSSNILFDKDKMLVRGLQSQDIILKRRKRPSMDFISCDINANTKELSISDKDPICGEEYCWELWDKKWGKLIRHQKTQVPFCQFSRDFYVDAYLRVIKRTSEGQTLKQIVALFVYQSGSRTHKVISLDSNAYNLNAVHLQMEWVDAQKAVFTVLSEYCLPCKINWHIYRNGGHYYHIFGLDLKVLEYTFTEPGKYTVMANMQSMDSEIEFLNLPQFEIKG